MVTKKAARSVAALLSGVLLAGGGLAACGSSAPAAAPPSSAKSTTKAASTSTSCSTMGRHPGITSHEILLGVSAPETGTGAADWGSVLGEEAYFKYVNEHGGVDHRQIKLIALNDEYNPSMNITNVRQLIEKDHVFALAGGNGTPNTLASIPIIVQSGIPDIAPNAPSRSLGTMKTPNVYVISPNYAQQFDVLTSYLQKTYHPTSYSLVGVTGSVDESALAGMKEAAPNVKINNIPETPGTANMGPLAAQLQRYNAPWVLFILTDPDTGNLLEAMRRIGYDPHIASWSGMTEQAYLKPYGAISQGLIAIESESTPDANPLAAKNTALYRTLTGHAPNTMNELGWVQAELTVKALRDARALTWSCVEASLDSIRNFKTGYFPPISFGPRVRQGTTASALVEIKGSRLVPVEGFTSVGS